MTSDENFERRVQERAQLRNKQKFEKINTEFLMQLVVVPLWTEGMIAALRLSAAEFRLAAQRSICELRETLEGQRFWVNDIQREEAKRWLYERSRGEEWLMQEVAYKVAKELLPERSVQHQTSSKQLSRKSIVEIVDLLMPVMPTTVTERKMLLDVALIPENSLLSQINLGEPPKVFVTQCVQQFDRFGEIEPGIPALARLLEIITPQMDSDQKEKAYTLRMILYPELMIAGFPPLVRRWAELASGIESGELTITAGRLRRRVRELVAEDNTAEALAWIEAGSYLAKVFGGELEDAVLLSTRQIELNYRRAQDGRHLKRFVARIEQIDAFERLMSEDNNVWALHYLGMGGVGKTMLLRYITAALAPKRNLPIVRIDFDHLNPDYPSRRPSLLLEELADELQVYTETTRGTRLFEEFERRVRRIREIHAKARKGITGDLDGNEFADVLRVFCDILRLMERPVLLILDTCEELAKVNPDGGMLPNVRATFEILERIHNAVPQIRVIFAGRRLLASEGMDWRAQLLPEQVKLPVRSYLLLHEIRGFTRQEAEHYLSDIPRGLREAILARSPDVGRAATLDSRSSSVLSPLQKRYNPFDLGLYADWAREDRKLTVERIRSGTTDPYVELRIIGRLGLPKLQALLPAIVLLRRFERSWLDLDDPLYQELCSQEWIDIQHDEALKTVFLEIDGHLYPRLQDYYRDSQRRGVLAAAAPKLAERLYTMVQDLRLSQLSISHIDAALRLLPAADAIELWRTVERRVADEAAWDWAMNVCERLLALEDSGQRLPWWTSVRATYISALLHTNRDYDAADDWGQMQHIASRNDEWLQMRTQFSTFDVLQNRQSSNVIEFPSSPSSLDWNGTQLYAGWLALLERVLEIAETNNGMLMFDINTTDVTLPRTLKVWSFTLFARLGALNGTDAELMWERALNALDDIEDTPQIWLDWRVPDALPARVRLEYLRHSTQHGERYWKVVAEALERKEFSTIDDERLAAFALSAQLGRGLVSREDLTKLLTRAPYNPRYRSVCRAHRVISPLRIVVASGLSAVGEVARACDVLDELIFQIQKSDPDPQTVDSIERIQVEIVVRWRLRDRYQHILNNYEQSLEIERRALAWRARVLIGAITTSESKVLEPQSAEELHAWWHAQSLLNEQEAHAAEQALTVAYKDITKRKDNDIADLTRAFLLLDRLESQYLIKADTHDLMLEVTQAIGSLVREQSMRVGGRIELARLGLRSRALNIVITEETSKKLDQVYELLGERTTAKLALEEGELLALRLPKEALVLLYYGADAFRQSNDPYGRFFAVALSALATLRLKETDVISILKFIVPLYDELRTLNPELPEWDKVSVLNDNLIPAHWHGWLVRLLTIRVGAASDEAALFSLSHMLLEEFGNLIPRELMISTVQRKLLATISPAKSRPMWQRVIIWSGIAAAVVAGYVAFGWLLNFLLPGITTSWWYLLLYVFVLIMGGIGSLAEEKLRPRLLWGISVALIGLIALGLWYLLVSFLIRILNLTFDPVTQVNISAAALLIVLMLATLITPLLNQIRRRTMHLQIIRSDDIILQETALRLRLIWPSLQTTTITGVDEVVKRLVDLRKQDTGYVYPLAFQGTDGEDVINLLENGNQKKPYFRYYQVEGALSGHAGTLDLWKRDDISAAVILSDIDKHIRAAAVTAYGNNTEFLQLGGKDYRQRFAEATYRYIYMVGTPIVTDSGLLFVVGTDILPSVSPNIAPLFIVQMPSTDAETEQTTTERQQTANLKKYGSQLFATGAYAVLVIPPLPSDSIIRLMNRMRSHLSNHNELSLQRLLKLQDSVHEELFELQLSMKNPQLYQDLKRSVMLFAHENKVKKGELLMRL